MSDIKLFAGYYVYFQENLSSKDKITFFNFIKEATDNQVSHLLITGKMLSEEMIRENYADWIDKSQTFKKGVYAGQTQGAMFAGGIAAAALAATLAVKVYKNYLSKAAKACKGKKGPEKQQCMRKAKLEAMKQKIMSLTKAQGACSKTKQPEKCVAKLKLKIAKEKIKMKKIKF